MSSSVNPKYKCLWSKLYQWSSVSSHVQSTWYHSPSSLTAFHVCPSYVSLVSEFSIPTADNNLEYALSYAWHVPNPLVNALSELDHFKLLSYSNWSRSQSCNHNAFSYSEPFISWLHWITAEFTIELILG